MINVFAYSGAQTGVQLSQFSTRAYPRADSMVKRSFSEWQITFENLKNCFIREYKKKVILPSSAKPRNEFDYFVSIRFQCHEAPTCSSRTEYLPGDQPSVPAPETFPLALIAYNEINAFVGCEIRLGFRRFNWKSKDLPDTWMWPAIDGFLGM